MTALGRDVMAFFLGGRHRRDPYPFYRRLREAGPVHRTPFGLWLVTGHAEAAAALRHPALSSALGDAARDPAGLAADGPLGHRLAALARTAAGLAAYAGPGLAAHAPVLARVGAAGLRGGDGPGPFARLVAQTLLLRDPPDHTRLRRLVSRAFTPRVVDGLRPRIEGLTAELIDRAASQGSVDLMAAVAYPLPLTIICELLGAPNDEHHRLIAWSQALVVGLDPVGALVDPAAARRADQAALDLAAYLGDLVAARRAAPAGDLVSALAAAGEGDDGLTNEEIVVMCALLLIAGHETTVNLVGNGLVALLRHPDAAERWRADPALAPTAVDELLRFDSPVQTAARRATEPVPLGDRTVEPGDVVMVVVGAANRDPAHVEDPDALVLDRDPNPHLSFGSGPHYCLGAALARAEAQVVLPALLDRRPRLAVPADRLAWRPGIAIRGLRSLPVSFP